ncbi:PEPxxWA-CTERM sorting domain-containing protein [Phenylobacterium sp.]|uniref:PEPxxWA-CTERM sorting domain-containing protein n=1 Tax=Phenylobacterium sp. TaxID=1871053 RepID=UPI0011FF9FF5|nr:PEPxxWA-CTERM sorting domain-containing protein [Phenylobacterium sp.]THD58414.1 MAG: PEP-CTERM sorting domain-containing protein [Phenylobacterium sp.]
MQNRLLVALIATTSLAVLGATAAQAGTVVVTALDGSQGWSSPAGENTGGGTAAITNTPIDGNGSLALTGDRSRVVFGGSAGLYGNPTAPGATNNLGALSQFTDLSFSYQIDPTSVSALDAKYSPLLGLTIWNGNTRDELVYEAAYQTGGYAAEGAIGTLNVTDSNALFYLNSEGDPNDAHTLADWLTIDPSLASDVVGGFYVGVGSGAGAGYLAHVDDITADGTTYNFETAAGVPEPADWALMILGFAGAGAVLRRRQGVLAA